MCPQMVCGGSAPAAVSGLSCWQLPASSPGSMFPPSSSEPFTGTGRTDPVCAGSVCRSLLWQAAAEEIRLVSISSEMSRVQMFPLIKICGQSSSLDPPAPPSSSSEPSDGNNSHCLKLCGKPAGCITESLSLTRSTQTHTEHHDLLLPPSTPNYTHTPKENTHFSQLSPHLTCFC